MNEKSVILVTRTMDGKSESFNPGKSSPAKVAAKPGTLYLLKNTTDNFAPENITVKRVGKNLQVFSEGDDTPCLVLEDYFADVEGSESTPTLLGMSEDGQIYQYVPLSGEGYDAGYLMADGQMSPMALGGDAMGAGDAFFAAQPSDPDLWPILLGLFALAGAVGGGMAIAHHNRDKGDSHHPVIDTTPPESKGVGGALDNTGSKTGPLKPGEVTDETRPQLTGTGEPGNTITIYDNDKPIGSTTVDDNGNWSWTPDAPLTDGNHELVTTETDKNGNEGAPSPGFEIVVDTTPPAAPTTPPTTNDNVGDKTGPIKDGEATDDPQPELSGTGEPGNTIDVWDNGEKIGSTTVDEDGNWSWKPEAPLADGDHNLSTTETDEAGNTSEPSPGLNIVVDTVPPTGSVTPPGATDNVGDKTGPINSGDITDDPQPELSGTGEPGNTIDVWDNGEKIGSTTVDEDGNWTWKPDAPLADGNHEITTTERDDAGNSSEPSPGLNIVVDTVPPTGSVTPPTATDNVGDKTGPINSGDTTDDPQPELSGTGEPGNTIDVWDNGEKIGSTTVDEDGNWSWKPDAPLADGNHEITTTERDDAGNSSEPSPGLNIVVDTVPPTGSVTPPTATDNVGDKTGPINSGDVTDDPQPELSGKGDPGNTIDVWDNGEKIGSTTVDEDGNWSWKPDAPLADGNHEITTTERDDAGNSSEPSPGLNIVVDTEPTPGADTPPTATDSVGDKTGPLNDGDETDDTQPEFAGKGGPGNTIDVWDNGEKIGSTTVGDDGTWSWKPDAPLGEGDHTISTTETDKAGNTTAPSPGLNIVVDTTPPAASETPPTITDNVGDKTGPLNEGDSTDDTQPELSGKGDPGNTIDVWDNGEKIGSTTVDEDGNWSWKPDAPLGEGDHTISTTETDPAGNTSEPSPGLNIVVDTTPPAASETPPTITDNVGDKTGPLNEGDSTDDTQPELSGKGDPGNTIDVWDNGEKIGSTTVDEDGNWSWKPDAPLGEGDHTISTTETDPAGNTSEPSPGLNIVVDTTPPAVSETPPTITDNVGDKTGPLNEGDSTDDTQPELSGKGDPGNTIDVWDNGEKIGSTTVDDNGNWSWKPDAPLGEGDHTISTTETDPAGNTSEPSPGLNIVVDTTPPETNDAPSVIDQGGKDITGGGETNDSQPEISGKGEPGNTIDVWDNGEKIGSTTVDDNGNWSWKPDAPLADGDHTISTTETDPAGNTSEPSPDTNIIVDTIAPATPSMPGATDNVGDVTGPIKNGDATDDTQPELSGKGEPGNTIDVWDNGEKIGSTTVDDNGNWSWKPDAPLGEGDHALSTTETDTAGNTSEPSPEINIVVDTTPPDVHALSITGVNDTVGEITGNIVSGGKTDDSRPTIAGTGTAGDMIILYTTDASGKHAIGSSLVDANGKWSIQPESPLLAGENVFSAKEVDPAGNNITSDDYTVTLYVDGPSDPSIGAIVDNAGPVTGPLQKGDITDDAKPTISGTASAGDEIRVYDNGTLIGSTKADENGNWSFTPDVALADGSHNISITATDSVGQTSKPGGDFGFTVDTLAPDSVKDLVTTDNEGAVRGPIENGATTDDTTPTLSGTAEPGGTVNVYDDGKKIGEVDVADDGTWSWTPDDALKDGDHKITVTVTDEAGNESAPSQEITVTVDTVDPTAQITSVVDSVGDDQGNITPKGVTDDTQPVINGIAKPGSVINIYDGKTLLGSATSDVNGKWSFKPETALTEGSHSLTVTATDKAGNTSDPSGAFEFEVDITSPVLPVIDGVTDDVGNIRGEVANGGMTDDASPTLHGTAEADSVITIYDGATKLGSVKADASGKWSFTPTTPIAEGDHRFTVTATDKAGNISDPSNEFVLSTDYSAPDASQLAITGFADDVGEIKGNIGSGGNTDDTMPVISGTGTAGDIITLYTTAGGNKVLLGTTTVGADGKWSLALDESNALPGGVNQITAVETDPVGNSTSPTPPYTVTVYTPGEGPGTPSINTITDDVGLHTGTLQKGDVTDDSTPTLQGTGGAGDTIRIYDNGTLIGSTTVGSNGTWIFTPSSKLADGSHAFTADAVNKVGQVSDPSGVWDVTIDTAAPNPVTDLVITDDVGSVQGPIESGKTTDDSTPTFSGSAEPGSTVNVYDGDKKVGEVEVGNDGKWTYTPDAPLADGDHNLSVSVTDPAGNESSRTPPVNVTVDTKDAPVQITSVVDDVGSVTGNITPNGVTDDTKPTINGSGKAGSIVTVYDGTTLLGSTTIGADGKWSFTPTTALGDGQHTLNVKAVDPAGNPSDANFGLTVDTAAPIVPTITGALDDVGAVQGNVASGGVTDDPTPTLSGTAEAGSTVIIYDGAKAIGSVKTDANGKWSFTPTSNLTEGEHHFTVTATDTAGNVSETSNGYDLSTDYTAPDSSKLAITGFEDDFGEVKGNVVSGGKTDDTTPVISGTATAGDIISVYATVDGSKVLLGTTTVGADGTWKLAVDAGNALPTNKVVQITAVESDAAGNVTAPTPPYVVTVLGSDQGPPTPSINSIYDDAGSVTGPLQKDSVTDDNTPMLNGNGGAGDTIRIYDNGVLIGSTTVSGSGSWSFTPSPALKDGSHAFTADAVNSIGQVSDKSGEWNISIDTAAPNPVGDLVITDNVGDVQGVIKPGDTTDDSTPTFSGSAEPGSNVNIYDGNQKIGTAVVGDDGKWTFTPDAPMGDGDHNLSVSVTDPAGNESPRTPPLNVTVDTTTAPVQITSVVDDVGSVTGNIARDGVTDDTKPTINGSGKAGSIVTVYDGTTLLGSTTIGADGKWSFTPTTALSDGQHSLNVKAVDPAGNPSDASFGLTIDTAAPVVPTIDGALDDVGAVQGNVASGGVTDDPTPTLSGTAEAGSTVIIYDGATALGSVKADANGKWSFTPTSNLTEGEHHFTVTATDTAGNVSVTSNGYDLTTDFTAPDSSKLAITGFEDDFGEVKGNVISGGKTDDTTPVISGTATAGDIISVYATVDGSKVLLGTTTVGADGTWKLAVDAGNALPTNKVVQITAVESDAAGNVTAPTPPYVVTVLGSDQGPSTPSINSIYDDAGSVTGPLQKDSVTDDNTPMLNGNGGAGDTIRIYDNGVLIGSTKVDGNGGWSFTPSPALKDGSHSFTADAVDSVGLVSDKSGEWNISIDTVVPNPVADLTVTDNVGDVQGVIKPGDTTDDSTPTFSGSAEPGSNVNIYDGNQKIGTAVVGDDGKWTFTPDAPMGEGDHNLSVSVTDPAGNESPRTPPLNVTVDTTTAPVQITSVVDDVGSVTGNIARDGVTDDTKPTINGSGKAGSIVTVYDGTTLLGSTTIGADGKWSFTPTTALSDGQHSLNVKAVDPAGNPSDASFGLTIDTAAPVVPTIDGALDDVGAIQGNVASGGVTDDPTPTLSGTAEAGSTVIIYDGAKALGSVKADANGKWSFTPTSNLSEGNHHFTVTATDAAGNVSVTSNGYDLTTDFTAPDSSKLLITGFEDNVGEVTGNIASGGSTDDTTPVISGTGTAGDTITLYTTLNGNKVLLGTTTVGADGTWKLALDESNALKGGLNQISAVESDLAGNSITSSNYVVQVVVGDLPAAPSINTIMDDVGIHTGTLQKGDVTDDSKPNLQGSSGPDMLIRIYDNGVLIGSVKADNTGSWSFTPSTSLKDGDHAFTADAVDSIGQVSDKSGDWNISIDTVAPNPVGDLVVTDNAGKVQGPIKNGDTTDDSTPTFSGSAEPGSTVNVYDNDQKIGTVIVGDDGKWTFTPDAPLSDTDHSLSVSVTDNAGNESTRTPPLNIIVDTADVEISITSVVDNMGAVTGNITPNGVTDDTTPIINGNGKSGSVVKVYDGSTLLGSTTVDASGKWSFTPEAGLRDGVHTITANATDTAGNVSDDVSFGFTIDTVAPSVPTIDSAFDDVGSVQGPVSNGGVTDDPTPTLNGTAEAGSIVIIYDGVATLGSVKADANGKWTFTPTSTLPEGSHHFTVTATDAAGNVSAKSNGFDVMTDYTAPDSSKLAITGFEDNEGLEQGNVVSGGSTDDKTPVLSGTGSAGDTITVYTTLNGTKILLGTALVDANGKWSLSVDAAHALDAGKHSFTAVETDPAGNSISTPNSYDVTIVGQVPGAPSINTVVDDVGIHTGTLQKNDVTDDSKPTLSGSAGADVTVRIYDNGALIGSVKADSNGNWSFTPSTALKDGSHAFTADVVDSVGQVSDMSGEFAISVDTTPPAPVTDLVITDDVGNVQGPIKNGDTTDDSTPTFSGSAEAGGTVNIYDGGNKVGEIIVGDDGKWTWTPDAKLSDGDHSLSVSVTDKAGNESTRTPPVNVTVDTTGGPVSIDHLVDNVGSIQGNVSTGGVTDDVQPQIVGSAKAGSIVKVYDGNILLGSTVADANGNWTFISDSDLANGTHTINAKATDPAGNPSESAFVITVDTIAPTNPTITNAYDDVGSKQGDVMSGGVTDDPTPTLSGNAEAGSIVTIYDGAIKLGSVKADATGKWSYTPTSTLAEGEHHFTVTATDAAGNVSGKSNDYVVNTDYTPPNSDNLAITGYEDNEGTITGNVTSGGTTDDATPVISGTGTAGDTITLYSTLNGTKILLGTAVVDANGKWSLPVTNPLADGTHNLTAVETDPAGNSTNPSGIYNVTVQTGTPPSAPSITAVIDDVGAVTQVQKDGFTDDNTPTLKGSAGTGMVVRVYDNGTLIGSTTTDNLGNWAFTPDVVLKDGNHAFTADAVNNIGQVSPKSGDWSINIDTAAPDTITSWTITDNVGAVQGVIKNGDTTDDKAPVMKGTAEANSVVTIYDGNSKIGSAKTDASGNWTFTPSLTDGNHKLSVTATDTAGNESTRSSVVDFNVDTSTVAVTIDTIVDNVGAITGNIAPNGVTDDATPTFNGAGKAGSIVKIYDGAILLGSTTVGADGRWTYTPASAMSDGTHNIRVNATDTSGNVSDDVTRSFTVDTLAPTAPTILNVFDDVGAIQGNLTNPGITDDSTPTLSGKAEAGSIVIIYDGATALGSVLANSNGDWSYTTPVLGASEHHFTVTATDAAGNVSGKSGEFVVTTDYTPPDSSKLAITGFEDDVGVVTGNVGSGGSSDDTMPVISGTGTAGDTITIYTTVGGTKITLGTAIVDASGKWQLALDETNKLSEGLNSLSAVESDPAGNATAPTPGYNVTIVSPTFPAPTINGVEDNAGKLTGPVENHGVTDDTTPTLKGNAEANSTVIIYNNGRELGRTIADSTGVWNWTVAPALPDGDYNFTAKAQSSAGQVSEASNEWAVTIDVTPPAPVADLVITDDVGTNGSYTGPLKNGDFTDDNTPTLSGTAEKGSTVTIFNGNNILDLVKVGDDGRWSWEPKTPLADGSYGFSVTVTDTAGNVSAPTPVTNITVDTVVPNVDVSITGYYDNVGTDQGLMSGSNGVTDDVNPILTGTWAGDDLGTTEKIRIYQDGIFLGEATVNRAARTWTYATKDLENAHAYHFTATAVDAAGNETAISPEFVLTIDLDIPTQTVTIDTFTDNVGNDTGEFTSGTTTDDRNPILNGKVSGIPLDPGDVVRIYDVASGQLLGSANVDTTDNSWSFKLPPLQDDMSYSYRAVVADAAGNEGTTSGNFNINVNLTVNINSQNTLDPTPIISGSTGFDIQEGEYLEVTVNGHKYSSQNGQVVIDLRNNTWYVQVPDADAMVAGIYDVSATLFDAKGLRITQDDSVNELVITDAPSITFTATGATAQDTSTAITIGENGTWRILSNSAVFTQNGKDSTTLGSFDSIVLKGTDVQQQSTFIDMDRDGLMDIMGADTAYANGQQSFKYDGKTYTAFQVGAYGVTGQTNNGNGNAYVWYGGAAGIDIDGDGYVDIIYGDETPNDAEARGGYDTTFVMNTNGTIEGFTKSGSYVYTQTSQNGVPATNSGNPTPDREIASVDLNNDGYVDIVYHGTAGTNTTSAGGSTGVASRLVIVENNRDASGNVTLTNTQVVTGVFLGDRGEDGGFTTLTWADLNGDGYMDLFVGGLGGQGGTTGAQSAIYYNDGTGKFVSAANGVGAGSNVQLLGDNVNSNTSLAVDWNGDGKMDVIEIAGTSGSTAVANANNIGMVWLNNGINTVTQQVNWTQETLLTGANLNGTNVVTGALAIDLDYDGDQDLVVFRGRGGKTEYIENKNTVTDGTSIILRVLDANGVNSFYGNTVMLIDDATGKVVSSQMINPQGGVNMNNSTGLVYFYGLDSTKSYSAVLLANGSDVGGTSAVTVNGKTNIIENVNTTWGGLKAVEANHAYTLTAESSAHASNSATALGDGTNTTGIVGTGYNDTLYATAGQHVYNGGGGSIKTSGVTNWSDTGGMDIVDYKMAGNTALTIDMNNIGFQNTGFGSAKFVNIEGIAGGGGNDTFTGNSANNFFEGRGGDDTFNLNMGGQDTLIYNALLNAGSGANNGGNGKDTVIGFTIGTVEATPDADIIDISHLLIGYTADSDGAAHYINGVATIDAGDKIKDFLSVTHSGNDTILNIDRDGLGAGYGMSQLITFKDTNVDLETLLANHQITLS